MSDKTETTNEETTSLDKTEVPTINTEGAELSEKPTNQELKWDLHEEDFIDEEQIYFNIVTSLMQMKKTSEILKEKGLGGELIGEAINVLQNLVNLFSIVEITEKQEEENSAGANLL